jgi:hypothetical protein
VETTYLVGLIITFLVIGAAGVCALVKLVAGQR